MAVHWPTKDERQAVPLFKLEDGVASSSAGLVCAENASVNKNVIARAYEIIAALKSGEKIEPSIGVIRSKLKLSPDATEALTLFLKQDDWREASESDVRRLIHHIHKM